MGALDQIPGGARVLIIRLRSLGDCVLTTPAIAILRQARPDLRLGIVVEPRFSAVFEGNPDVDEVLAPSSREVAAFAPSLCINLHGGTRSLALTLLSRARLRAGFVHYRHSWMYNVRIPRAQEILGVDRTVHTAEHLASAMFYLGAPEREIPRGKLFAKAPTAARPYAVLHPMASAPEKTWPAQRFIEVANHLESRCTLDPVFIAGPGENLDAFARWRRVEAAPLQQTLGLLKGASLFIGNDSGPAHCAAALGVPVVVLYGSSDPLVWAPWRTQAESIVARGSLGGVETRQVIDALERLRVKA